VNRGMRGEGGERDRDREDRAGQHRGFRGSRKRCRMIEGQRPFVK
jgi:hypothetical protein